MEDLQKFVKDLKNLNPAKAKFIAEAHINIASHIAKSIKNMDYKQLYRLEQKCILGLDNKDTYKAIVHDIEAKIIKMYDKVHILRSLCMFSIINGGLD